MRTLIALYDAPLTAAAALRALAAAGFPPADVDALPPPSGLPQAGDWAAEVALRHAAAAPDAGDTAARAAAVAGALGARGVPADRAAAAAARVAEGRGWLVAVVAPDRRAALAERALTGAAPLELLSHLHAADGLA